MKNISIATILLSLTLFSGCGSDTSKHPKLMHVKENVNPNSIVVRAQEQALERKNKIELAKIEAKTKVEVEKIKAEKDLKVAKLQTQTQKELGIKTATTQVEMKKIDAKVKEKSSYILLIIAAIFGLILLFVFYMWYKHKKRQIEIEVQLEKERLEHQKELKEREFQEQRLHKMIDLAADGKLPKQIEQELLLQITHKKGKR